MGLISRLRDWVELIILKEGQKKRKRILNHFGGPRGTSQSVRPVFDNFSPPPLRGGGSVSIRDPPYWGEMGNNVMKADPNYTTSDYQSYKLSVVNCL